MLGRGRGGGYGKDRGKLTSDRLRPAVGSLLLVLWADAIFLGMGGAEQMSTSLQLARIGVDRRSQGLGSATSLTNGRRAVVIADPTNQPKPLNQAIHEASSEA